MKTLILADIHANLSALEAVLKRAKELGVSKCILLGDIIDYGMRPNETIKMLSQIPYEMLVNIWGNHEKAIIEGDLDKFSSERGREFSAYTEEMLTEESKAYIVQEMDQAGALELMIHGRKCLFVHGSLEDVFWKSISAGTEDDRYRRYDYVFSGHSHRPHMFESYYMVNDKKMRNEKKTVFINPGSVGQPRNHVNYAQFAVLNMISGEVSFERCTYDLEKEKALFNDRTDAFYKDRIELGI